MKAEIFRVDVPYNAMTKKAMHNLFTGNQKQS
jgi:hypothetical protein